MTEREYVICPFCGSGYSVDKIISSIAMKSPFIPDLDSWTTRVVCTICKKEFSVSGSHDKVFVQPKRKG